VGVSIAATAAAGAFIAMAFALPSAAPAGATTACSASGDQCLTALQPQAGAAAGTPFSSGQLINVVIPANQTFVAPDNTIAKQIVECAAPNGVLPTQSIACDGLTIQGPTVLPSTTGAITLQNYTVYALPDTVSLGEVAGGQPVCGNTLATECVLYVGDNFNDFTKPHLWSEPFLITANGNDLGANPGDGTPEVPMAILLPVAAMGLLGGAVAIRRRRKPAKVA
jgi:hypothetical protein